MRSDQERLNDILYFIDQIEREYNVERFEADEVYRYGLVKFLEIICEACRSLKSETRELGSRS